jgi:hypothetical protein
LEKVYGKSAIQSQFSAYKNVGNSSQIAYMAAKALSMPFSLQFAIHSRHCFSLYGLPACCTFGQVKIFEVVFTKHSAFVLYNSCGLLVHRLSTMMTFQVTSMVLTT